MSRLYCWVASDTGETTVTKTGNTVMEIVVNYGNKDNSKKLVRIKVNYPKGMERPLVTVMTS